MTVSIKFCRNSLLIGVALLVIVAIVIAVGVIPPVKNDTFLFATPESAATGFWVNVDISLIISVALSFIAIRTKVRSRQSTVLLGILAFVTLVLALALTDARDAYMGHGPAMQLVPILLLICIVADLLAAILIIVTAFLYPKKI